jgi:3-demethylubiquinone-9 3-methyltransferase
LAFNRDKADSSSPSSSPCWACHSSASNAGPHVKFNEAVSFQVFTDSQEETDRYWNAIVGNGVDESQCSWCKDKFGLSWQIVPRALMNAMADPDRSLPCISAPDSNEESQQERQKSRLGARAFRSQPSPLALLCFPEKITVGNYRWEDELVDPARPQPH